jgi:putative NADPH-quinone reductase
MMKTLVILIHSNLDTSVVNKRWIEELKKYPEQYVIHDLHSVYPDEKIDVEYEQRLIEAHDRIIFQFPFYWFNCPPFFKKWLDEVLTHGWAYGKGSEFKMAGKKIALGVTVGINEADYSASGRYKYTLQQLTAPFELTFDYIRADYRSFFAFYGVEYDPATERIAESAREYLSFINGL